MHVLPVSEMWLKPDLIENDVSILGFIIKARRDRNDGHQGGGCLIYIHVEIKNITTMKDDLERNDTEATYIEIRFKNTKACIGGCLYRPEYHIKVFTDSLHETISQMQNKNKEIYLLCNFNCDIIVNAKKPITKQLLEVCKDALLEQMINEPTRITEDSKTALDLIFTSHFERDIQTGVLHFGISEHSMAFMVRCFTYCGSPTHIYNEIIP